MMDFQQRGGRLSSVLILVFLNVVFLNFPPKCAAVTRVGCDGKPVISKCLEPVDKTLYGHWAVLNKATYGHTTNCYFLVKGESYLVKNGGDGGKGRLVDLNHARRVCDEHDAFLPNVLSERENEFLTQQFHRVTPFVLLGLQRATYEDYIWDNLHGPAFKPKIWKTIKEKTTQTYTLLDTHDGHWTEYYPNQTWPSASPSIINLIMPDKPPIVCQQRGYGPLGDSFSDARGDWVPSAANCSQRFQLQLQLQRYHVIRRRTRENNEAPAAAQQRPPSAGQKLSAGSLVMALSVTATILIMGFLKNDQY